MKENRYFKIGAFFLGGLTLFIVFVIAVGIGRFFTDVITIETYFSESVQGLGVGSAVKFRGVELGTVSDITFVSTRYGDQGNLSGYVLVAMDLEKELLNRFFGENILDKPIEGMQRAGERGLRVRLTTQGLTGVAYLEFNIMDTEYNPALALTWLPDRPYCPSSLSTMGLLGKSLDNIAATLEDLRGVHLDDLARTIGEILERFNTALKEANAKNIGELLVANLAEVRTGLRRINTVLASPELETLIPDAASAMKGLRHIVTKSQDNIIASSDNIRTLSASLTNTSVKLEALLANPKLEKGIKTLPDTLEEIATVARASSRSMVQLERMLRQFNHLTREEGETLRVLLEDTTRLIKNTNALIDDVSSNPSGLFFSEPPPKTTPQERAYD